MSSPAATAEEAARKAREIAAKLCGTPVDSSSGGASAGAKRKRWGVAPSENGGTPSLPGMDLMAKKLKQEKEPVQKRLWITSVTKERPAWHYVTYMRPGVEDIVKKVTEKNTGDEGGKLEITFKGRGSSGKPALPGIPEEPLHVFIEGPPVMAEEAETEVETLLQEAEKAEVTVDITQEDGGPVGIGDVEHNDRQLALTGSHGASYRPATVAQLIGHNSAGIATTIPAENWPIEELQVPNGVVGFIIGRGGETITSMQARTGAKVQIQKEHELQPGQTLRVITVSAPTQEAVDQCKTMITSMVEERVGSMPGGKPPKEAKVQAALDQGHVLKTVEVPDADVGLVIGKGGTTIQHIQDRTGASVQIPPAANAENGTIREVSITHPTEMGAQEAATMIAAILASKKQQNAAAGSVGGPGVGAQTTIQVMIPDKDVGLCIGRQGCVIKEMQNKTNTRIQIPGAATPGQPHRIATVSGTPDACEQVRQMIERIIVEQSSGCVMSGTGGGGGFYNHGGYQQHDQQQQGGDYSAEWAAYYAAQEQVAQQQQAPAPTPAPGPAADAYYEEFFRYSYYYGEPAARQYYGAWSPPPGTANPYGVNPAGVTAPPANGQPGATAAAPTPAPAPAPVAQQATVQETSVRKVSNLPAWMTSGKTATAAAPQPVSAPAVAAAAAAAPHRETSVRKVSNLPAWMTRQQN